MVPIIRSFYKSFENRLEPRVRQHLKNVYGAVTMAFCAASTGAYIHTFTLDVFTLIKLSLLWDIVMILILLLFITSDDTGNNINLRLSYLVAYGFATGMCHDGLGSLLERVIIVDPAIVMTALLGSTIIFVSLSAAAMLAVRNSWLVLYCPLMTLFITITLLSLLNIFVNSNYIYQIELHVSLMVLCGLVLAGTQLIIERRRMGRKDFVYHAFGLFMIFLCILTIITKVKGGTSS